MKEDYKVDDNLRYEPSDSDRHTLNKLYDRFQSMIKQREKSYSYFNDRSITTYINESMQRWNGYIPPKDNLKLDWQATVFNNFTHNVCISLLSKVAMARPKARFVATNKDGYQDTLRAHVLEKGLEYTHQRENGEWKFFNAALEWVTKGTVVVYEGYRKIKRTVEEIDKYDPTTGKVESHEREIVDYNDCYREVIPLEEIYFGNLWLNDVQMMPDIIWKRVMMKTAFYEEFSKYPNCKYVKPGNYTMSAESIPYYKQKEYFQLDKNSIEVIQWYNKWKDRLIVSANGVLLYEGPIPFAHKQYPFAVTIFEPFASDFIYGRSLPDKVASDQDTINTTWNMMIDQNWLSIYKPTMTDDPDYINEYPLQPGRMFPVSDINKYKILDIPGPPPSSFDMLNLSMKFANDNSGNLAGGGGMFTSGRGKQTARQAMMIEEQMRQALGINIKMLENLEVQAEKLRAKNFLQFYTIPEKVEAVTGQKNAMQNFIRVLKIDSTELSDGTHGTTVLKIAPKNKLPSVQDLNTEEEVAAMQGDNIEVLAVTPDYIRNIDFDVQIVGESSFMQSKTLKQAMELDYVQVVTSNPMFQPLVNAEELLRDINKVFDKDPDRVMKSLTPPPGGPGGPGMAPGGPQPGPGGPNAQPLPQLSRQVTGGPPSQSLEKVL